MKSAPIQSFLGLVLRPRVVAATPFVTPDLLARTRWDARRSHSTKPIIPQGRPVIKHRIVPQPIPFVPDVKTFLTLIGRDMKQHVEKFPTWEALFTLDSEQLRELGVEPPRSRRYLLRMRQKFVEKDFGPGGDFKYVEDGVATLDLHEIDVNEIERLRFVVNVPPGKRVKDIPEEEREKVLYKPRGYKVKGARGLTGPYLVRTARGRGFVKVTEGMWEQKRGHKVDGGERRREEVRFKKRVAERKALKEKQGYY
ncbi:IGR protein motif-domain-containing protein [Podospora conica]|nr:IGR protein motif-domain-containing protein [Schizothecium conicum]